MTQSEHYQRSLELRENLRIIADNLSAAIVALQEHYPDFQITTTSSIHDSHGLYIRIMCVVHSTPFHDAMDIYVEEDYITLKDVKYSLSDPQVLSKVVEGFRIEILARFEKHKSCKY
jgi:hypothetical protein